MAVRRRRRAAAAAGAALAALAAVGLTRGQQLQGGTPVFTGDRYAGASAGAPWGGADPLAGSPSPAARRADPAVGGGYDPAPFSGAAGGGGAAPVYFPTLSDGLAPGGGALSEAYLEAMERIEEQVIVAAEENNYGELTSLLSFPSPSLAQDPGTLLIRGFAAGLPLEVAAKQAKNRAVRAITEALQESWAPGALPAEVQEGLDQAAYGAAREGNKGTTNILVDAGANAEMASAGAVAGGENRLDRHIRKRYDLGEPVLGAPYEGAVTAQQVSAADRSYGAVPGADYYESSEGGAAMSGAGARRRRWYCLWICRTQLSQRESDNKRRKEYERQRERDMQTLGALARQNGIRFLSGDYEGMEWPSSGMGGRAFAVEPETGGGAFSDAWTRYEQPQPEAPGQSTLPAGRAEENIAGLAVDRYDPSQRALNQPEARQKFDCTKVPERGSCTSDKIFYYFDEKAGACKMFLYGGCGGNLNRFEDQQECEAFCGAPERPGAREPWGAWGDALEPATAPTMRPARQPEPDVMDGLSQSYNHWSQVEQGNPGDLGLRGARAGAERCSLNLDAGDGKAAIPAFYFNARTKSCLPFTFRGFGGNANRFSTLGACEGACGGGAQAGQPLGSDTQTRLPRDPRFSQPVQSGAVGAQPADNIDPFSGMPRSVKLRVPQCGGSRDMEAPAFEVPPSPGGPMVLSVERVPPNTQVLVFVGENHSWHQPGSRIPAGVLCEGTEIDLRGEWAPGAAQIKSYLIDADQEGRAYFKLDQPGGAIDPFFCEKFVIQAVETASCQTSNTHDARGIMP